jgi:hypothetical protein
MNKHADHDGESQVVRSTQPPTKHLTQTDLARRWRVSERTLERWRWLKQGPSYLRIGGRVAYRVQDVEEFEANSLRSTKAFSSTGVGVPRR